MFNSVRNLIKRQFTTKNSKGVAPKATAAKSKQSKTKTRAPYFKRKWGIDDCGFATLRNYPGKANSCDLIRKDIQEMIEEMRDGVSLEPHYDFRGHKRYWKHPVEPIEGFTFDNKRFPVFFLWDPCHKYSLKLSIHQQLNNGQFEKLADINLYDNIIFDGYKPILDTRRVANDVLSVLIPEDKRNN